MPVVQPGFFVRRLVPSLLALLVLGGCSEDAAPAVAPEPKPVPAPFATEKTDPLDGYADEIVDRPDSHVIQIDQAGGDPDKRVVVWRLCASEECDAPQQAIALTQDGFETRIVPDRTWPLDVLVRMAPSGDVLVLDHARGLTMQVVRSDGTMREVKRSAEVSPVVAGELVAGVSYRPVGQVFWAVDTATALAHLVPVPEDTQQLTQTDDGQLRAITTRQSYAWSGDGGLTWDQQLDALDPHLLPGFVTSMDDTHAVIGGGDGATLFPFSQIRRLASDGSWSVVEPVDDPMAYIGPTAVLPDGRFFANVQSWSDNSLPGQKPRGTPPGIYVSDGDDWSTYERVESGRPFRTPRPFEPMVTDIDVTADGAQITAIGPDQTTAWTSNDLGATWREMRVR